MNRLTKNDSEPRILSTVDLSKEMSKLISRWAETLDMSREELIRFAVLHYIYQGVPTQVSEAAKRLGRRQFQTVKTSINKC